jgi:hypothetical protein
MLYRYTAYSSIVARWHPLRVRRACRHIMRIMNTDYTE